MRSGRVGMIVGGIVVESGAGSAVLIRSRVETHAVPLDALRGFIPDDPAANA